MVSRNSLTTLAASSAALIACLTLTGCLEQSVAPVPVATPSVAASATATAEPAAPIAVNPDGSADDNRRFFDVTNNATIAANGAPDGRAFIDALISAGFDRAAMEVTADKTAIGLQADNIQFSVRFGDSCLVGQYGNIGYASTVQPALSTGKCFIGNTRSIDW